MSRGPAEGRVPHHVDVGRRGEPNLRDSLSRTVTLRELDTTAAQIGTSYAAAQRVVVAVETDDGRYMLVAADSYLGLYNVTTSSWVWRQNMS